MAEHQEPAVGTELPSVSRAQNFVDDVQTVAAGIVVETANPEMSRTIAAPFSITGVELPPPRPGPALGAHSVEGLREAGVDAAAIAALRPPAPCVD